MSTWRPGGHYGLLVDLYRRLQGRITDPALETLCAISLGVSQIRMGQSAAAIACFERALERARENEDRRSEADALNGIGLGYADMDAVDLAISHHQEALEIYRDLKDRAGEAVQLMNLANQYSASGQEPTAIEYYKTALSIHREIQDARGEALTLANLGDSNRLLGDTGEALRCLAESYRIAHSLKYRLIEAAALAYEGEVFFGEGDFAGTVDRCRSAIELADGSGAIQFQCGARTLLAWAQLCRNELSSAEEIARKATEYNYPLTRNRSFLALGVVALRCGDYAGAKKSLGVVLQNSDDLLSRNPRNHDALNAKGLALCALALCDDARHLDAARQSFQAARSISSSPGGLKHLRLELDALSPADKTGLLAPVRTVAIGLR